MPTNQDIVKEAERQGWTVENRRNGWLLKAPDGVTTVTIHTTESDVRAFRNTIARMRRAGFIWPPPPRKQRKG